MKFAKSLHGKDAYDESDLKRGFKTVPPSEGLGMAPEEDRLGEVHEDVNNNDQRVGRLGPMKRGQGVD